MRWLALPLLALILAACSSAPPKKSAPATAEGGRKPSTQPTAPTHSARAGCKVYEPAKEDLSKRGDYKAGGLYAPHVPDTTPSYIPDVDCIPEPVVTDEAPSPIGNRTPYTVLGKKYEVMSRVDGYREQGTASYYGNKFHGRLTSNREVYDMYAFTAAHKTLPLPSFARVTNLDNGQSVVVRVNDRGPFHEGRVIDLSYAAAVKLGITQRGTGRVEVRALTPKDAGTRYAAAPAPVRAAPAQATPMDQLVGALPKQADPPAAAVKTAAAVPPPSPPTSPLVDPRDPGRYRIVPDLSKPASADRFDAWLAARNLKVVGGKIVSAQEAPKPAATPAATPVRSSRGKAEASAPATVASATPKTTAPAAVPAVAPAAASTADVWLQVASFSSRENADRALAQLSAAGIAGGSLSDIESNGRKFWRLRVGAPDQATATALAGRIAGLGFGQPQWVRK